MATIQAEVATVDFGFIYVEGLQLPDGGYAMGVSQVARLFLFDTTHASRTIKTILGKDFVLAKVKSGLNPKPVNILYLEQVKIVARTLDRQGNELATSFIDACLQEALERRFDEAFNIKRTERERNDLILTRVQGKVARRKLTDAIRDYLARHPEVSDNHRHWMYSNASEAVNLVVFKKKAKKLSEEMGVSSKDLRSHFDISYLNLILEVEDTAMRLIDKMDIDPIDAIKSCSDRLVLS